MPHGAWSAANGSGGSDGGDRSDGREEELKLQRMQRYGREEVKQRSRRPEDEKARERGEQHGDTRIAKAASRRRHGKRRDGEQRAKRRECCRGLEDCTRERLGLLLVHVEHFLRAARPCEAKLRACDHT